MSVRRGTIGFEADGKSHSLRLGTNQLAALEDAFGLTINDIVQKMQGKDVQVGNLRKFFAIACDLPEEEAGDVMDDIGLDRAGQLLGEAITAAFPKGETKPGNGRRQKRT